MLRAVPKIRQGTAKILSSTFCPQRAHAQRCERLPSPDALVAASKRNRRPASGRKAADRPAYVPAGTFGPAPADTASRGSYVPAGTFSVIRPTATGRAVATHRPESGAAAGIGDPQDAAGGRVHSALVGIAPNRPK